MLVFPKHLLLLDEHGHERLPVTVLLETLEERLLRLRHGTPDAMALPFELADIDAGAGRFRHLETGLCGWRLGRGRVRPTPPVTL